ncbi:C40 family peptidase [Bacillus sp. SY8(2021)]|uniref:C40 family peptidase n=2 Tax=Bacillus arachidis TaxID=2819290 RepID=A0ABS3NUF6_9BACI|nr:C40 family peptidase [Bacillus arachidis]
MVIDQKEQSFDENGYWIEMDPSASGIIDLALKQIGKPYIWGQSGPNSFDCSGFIYYVYKNNGYNIQRTSVAGYWPMATKTNDPRPGDLIFFQNTYQSGPSHVGIYLGNGEFVHAADEKTGVRKDNMSNTYYKSHFLGYARFTK